MSLLWPDHLRITLSPGQIELVHFSRRFSPKIISRKLIPVEITASGSHFDWLPHLEQLFEGLERRTNATIILSNHYVRYTIIPWSIEIKSDQERQALAQVCLERIYGEAVNRWSIKVSEARFGQPSLVSAVDNELVEVLHTLGDISKVKVRSIQPRMMHVINQYATNIQAPSFRLVVLEPGHLCMLTVEDEAYIDVKSLRIGEDWERELDIALARESVVAGKQIKPYLVLNGFGSIVSASNVHEKYILIPTDSHALNEGSRVSGLQTSGAGI